MPQGHNILVIDDDPDIREALTIILESQGYQVTTARYGAEGIEKVKSAKPDLIILDLIMPGVGGFAVYKKLKAAEHLEWNHIPIIVLTSLREEASRARFEEETGMKMRVEDYIEKPISPSIILEKVGKVLAK
ncbi:MAG: response regulator [Dehalococcoidia bacterium]